MSTASGDLALRCLHTVRATGFMVYRLGCVLYANSRLLSQMPEPDITNGEQVARGPLPTYWIVNSLAWLLRLCCCKQDIRDW